MPTPSRRRPVVVLAAVVVAVAGVLVLARRHAAPKRHVPTAAVSASPSPIVSLAPSSVPSAPTPTRVVPARSVLPTPQRSVPPPSPASSPALVPTTVDGVTLVDGPYGFKVPEGWRFTPLAATTATAQAAHWTDPASAGRIDYLEDNTSAIYSPDRTVNLGAIELNLPCPKLPPTSFTYISGKGPRYTCGASGGMGINGMVLILPYPTGFRLLQIQMAPAQDPVAAYIITGFH